MNGAVFLPLRPGRLVPLAPFDEAVGTVEELRARWPGCAVGVRADRAGLLVVDVDVKNGARGPETMRALQAELGELPETRVHRSRSGGWHLIFRAAEGVRSAQGSLRGAKRPAPGVDIVAARAVIRWVPGTPGYSMAKDRAVAELPERWVDALRDPPPESFERTPPPTGDTPARRYALAALEREALDVAQTGAMRNCRLTKAAGSLGQLEELAEVEVIQALMLACEENGSLREHGQRACQKTIERGLRWGRAHPRRGR